MIRFESDYAEGAHEAILRRLLETNLEQTPGYGTDSHCENARKWIREACGLAQADVQFLVGGTQTNSAVIASVLRPHEAVLAADTGHIACHETGAVEASGHKVLTIPGRMGKMEAARAEEYLAAYWADETHEHLPKPAMLYLSQPTECGTLYSLAELRALRDVADAYHLCVYVDGARLGYGLASEQGDVTLEALSSLADVFTIGGTKVGA
ncbi:MAG: aminotransferase class I/II-fold pyridoxal phosphate-dependent enzyme, partial [Clostridia bacterium]|nr:aminotransferase class I/II-fold pyridoxal phosphate-dependent enzyme [Clostridia bacterium]